MSTAKLTLGSILGAIGTTANTATNTLDALNKGVDMLNRTVSAAAEKQKITQKVDLAMFERTMLQDKAKELAESRVKLNQWMKSSVENTEHFATAFEELSAVLNPK